MFQQIKLNYSFWYLVKIFFFLIANILSCFNIEKYN